MMYMDVNGCNIFKNFMLWIGGFHKIICLLRTTFSGVKDSGIVEFLSATVLYGKGSIIHVLQRADFKYATHLQKLLYEALLWWKIKFLRENDTQEAKQLNSIASLIDDLRNKIDEITYRKSRFQTIAKSRRRCVWMGIKLSGNGKRDIKHNAFSKSREPDGVLAIN